MISYGKFRDDFRCHVMLIVNKKERMKSSVSVRVIAMEVITGYSSVLSIIIKINIHGKA